MTGFQHDIAGGDGGLIITALHSPDYVPGSTGWAIFKDGSVEFNSGIFRGTVTAGIFKGADFEINQAGIFFYSGTPANGNLIYSVANAPGTDSFGNPYQGPGPAAYGGPGEPFVIMSSNWEGSPGFYLPSNRPMEDISAGTFSFVANQGAANEELALGLAGPIAVSPNGDAAQINMYSSAKDGSATAQGQIMYFDASNNQYNLVIWGKGGVALSCVESMTAQLPGSSVPTAETWHPMAPLSTGFNLTGSGNYAVYKKLPDGRVSIQVYATVTAGSANAFKQLTTSALGTGLPSPGAYHPVTPKFAPMSANELSILTGSNNAGATVQLTAAGQLFVYGVATAATTLYISCDLPVDF